MREDAEHPTVHKAALPQQRIFLSKLSTDQVLRNLVLGSSIEIWPIGLQFKAVVNEIEEARSSLGDVFPY